MISTRMQAARPGRAGPRLPAALAGDLRGGLATLIGSVYLVVLIPMILGSGGANAAAGSVATTALAFAAGTALFALVARQPFAVGPGIVPASIVATFLASGIPFSTVLGIELLAGLLFLALSSSGAIQAWVRAAPPLLKTAGQLAIGLYLLLAALRATGVLQPGGSTALPPQSGLWFLAGLALVLLLHQRKRLGGYAVLIGMGAVVAGAAASGLLAWPARSFEPPALQLFMPDVVSAFDLRYLDEVLVLLYVVVVDVVATLETLGHCAPDLRGADGRLRQLDRSLLASALVFCASPFFGTAPMLVLFESLGGVVSGARSARAALVCVAGFAALLFVAPLAHAVPAYASAVALGYIGLTIGRHALAALPGAQDASAAGLAWPMAVAAVVVTIVTHSLALTLFTLFVLYPVFALQAGQRPRRADFAAAAAGLALMAMALH